MGGLGVVIKFEKAPAEAQLPTFHRALWELVRERLANALKSKVTRTMLHNYIDITASDAFAEDDWTASDDHMSFMFRDHGDDMFLKYASYHFVDRALTDGFDDAQALAKEHGATLAPYVPSPVKDVYFFIGSSLVHAEADEERGYVLTPDALNYMPLDELPEAAHAKQLLAEQRCECELCRPAVAKSATVTIIISAGDDPDELEAMSVAERRENSAGWQTFDVKSGRLLCTFFMLATHADLGVFASADDVDDEGRLLQTCMIFGSDLEDVRVPMLVERVETNPDETARALRARGGDTAELASIKTALTTGEWPTSGDPAEEAAAFAHRILKAARTAVKDQMGMGVCWEYRGDVVV